jgi:hypothetical protein
LDFLLGSTSFTGALSVAAACLFRLAIFRLGVGCVRRVVGWFAKMERDGRMGRKKVGR